MPTRYVIRYILMLGIPVRNRSVGLYNGFFCVFFIKTHYLCTFAFYLGSENGADSDRHPVHGAVLKRAETVHYQLGAAEPVKRLK